MSRKVAVTIAKNILYDSINALDIEMADGVIEKEYRYFDTKYKIVEEVVGLTTKEAGVN